MKASRTLIAACGLAAILVSTGQAYDIPQRKIELKPYVNVLIPSSLVEDTDGFSYVGDETGFGFGVKLRSQIGAAYGLMLNLSVTDAETSEESLSSATMFTGGGYYSKDFSIGTLTLDCGIGVLAVADVATVLLLPSVEYSRLLSERMRLAVELGWPISNDWFYNSGTKENFTSMTLSVGTIFVF